VRLTTEAACLEWLNKLLTYSQSTTDSGTGTTFGGECVYPAEYQDNYASLRRQVQAGNMTKDAFFSTFTAGPCMTLSCFDYHRIDEEAVPGSYSYIQKRLETMCQQLGSTLPSGGCLVCFCVRGGAHVQNQSVAIGRDENACSRSRSLIRSLAPISPAVSTAFCTTAHSIMPSADAHRRLPRFSTLFTPVAAARLASRQVTPLLLPPTALAGQT
jgi:hypothetical protein